MSLFGTGRKEGVLAACLLALLVSLAHLATGLGGELLHDVETRPNPTTAVLGAIGAVLVYRLLRAQGRTRYAAFVGGAAYGMSPLVTGLDGALREQFAMATVPLALEAAYQAARPSRRAWYLPWLATFLALPFATGASVLAVLGSGLTVMVLAQATWQARSTETRLPLPGLLLAVLCGALAAFALVRLDLFAPLVGPLAAEPVEDVFDGPPTLLGTTRLVGPLAAWFALFGMLRHQRQASPWTWLPIALLGLVPTFVVLLEPVHAAVQTWRWWPFVPAPAWWLPLLAIIVLGSAGLDDWLEQPLRRHRAHLVVLLVTLIASPLLALPASDGGFTDAVQLATVLGTFAGIAAVSVTWRRLGVLRFKNLLSAASITACALPVVLGVTPPPNELLGLPTALFGGLVGGLPHHQPEQLIAAAPLGEATWLPGLVADPETTWRSVYQTLLDAEPWQHAAIASPLLLAVAWLCVAALRRKPRRTTSR